MWGKYSGCQDLFCRANAFYSITHSMFFLIEFKSHLLFYFIFWVSVGDFHAAVINVLIITVKTSYDSS